MNNTYGTVKPSVIIDTRNDVEIWYRYTPNRSNTEEQYMKFNKIESSMVQSMLSAAEISEDTKTRDSITYNTLPGMFNLALPASLFGNPGFYTIYIKPKELHCTIGYVGALAASPDIRGIIIDMGEIGGEERILFQNDNLAGYRVEYFGMSNDSNTSDRQEYYRLVTSCGLCEPVSQNLTSSNSNVTGYRYVEGGSLSFLTLSPSTAPAFKGSGKPFIGAPGQKISISNTKFDPVVVEVEICRNDFDTITTTLTGNQIRSLDKGTVTTYNDNGEIFNQTEYYTIKSSYTNAELYEVRKKRVGNIDMTTDYDEIINS